MAGSAVAPQPVTPATPAFAALTRKPRNPDTTPHRGHRRRLADPNAAEVLLTSARRRVPLPAVLPGQASAGAEGADSGEVSEYSAQVAS